MAPLRTFPATLSAAPLHCPHDRAPLPSIPPHYSPGHDAAVLGSRAQGAVVGSLVADAAAMGVHWVYDLDTMAALAAEAAGKAPSPSSAAGGSGPQGEAEVAPLEFLDPPRSPFYAYPTGRNSP